MIDLHFHLKQWPWSGQWHYSAGCPRMRTVTASCVTRADLIRLSLLILPIAHYQHAVKSLIWIQPTGSGLMSSRFIDIFKLIRLGFGILNEQGAAVPVWLIVSLQHAKPKLRGLD